MTDTTSTIQRPRRQPRWLRVVLVVVLLIVGLLIALIWRNGLVKDLIKQIIDGSTTAQSFFTIDPENCASLDRYDCVYALNCKPNVEQSESCTGICIQEYVDHDPRYLGCIALTTAELQQREADQTDCEQNRQMDWHYGISNYGGSGSIPYRQEGCSCQYALDETFFSDGPLTRSYTTVSLGTTIKKVYTDACERPRTSCENSGGTWVGPSLLSTTERPFISQAECQVTEAWSEAEPTFLVWSSDSQVCEERTYELSKGPLAELSFDCQTSELDTLSDYRISSSNYFIYHYPYAVEIDN